MKVFITGATGFVGGRIARKLLQRGDQVIALVRSNQDAAVLQAAGAQVVFGDITERESLRAGMQGCDMVFHAAGWYKFGSSDRAAAEAINVLGTRNVLGLAFELGIPKIIYTSSVAAFGDTQGVLVTEKTPLPAGGNFKTIYDLTKWMAHTQAEELIAEGAPIIIVMPGAVFGPGDTGYIRELMTAFYQGLLMIVPGPEFTITLAHVEDIANGHLLAAEKGRPGESYFLAGPSLTLRETLNLWAGLTGRPAPLLFIPARFVKPFAPILTRLASWLPIRTLLNRDTLAMLDTTYTADSSKARTELGWQPRPLTEGLQETFEWLEASMASSLPLHAQRRRTASIALAAGLSLLTIRLIRRKREHSSHVD
jgi:nucleoside-diphosphate-sugar epimerase